MFLDFRLDNAGTVKRCTSSVFEILWELDAELSWKKKKKMIDSKILQKKLQNQVSNLDNYFDLALHMVKTVDWHIKCRFQLQK